ncbi:hypothetical protein CEP54_015871 [Fusarium duplospermum]|uniref:D-isomer specific 2-hydroxyacid dehydrogenase NAD-binding domain-containing protein n=1 Tax=Fusarium duplospermum TaxID=1325734 RepID=A0A428NKF0_9HYPO|nr:hypothetical protein CEP54_015871 [Fusarium duplospermum]
MGSLLTPSLQAVTANKPTIVYLGTLLPAAAEIATSLSSHFNIIAYKPFSQEEFYNDLQSPTSPLAHASAILRLGGESTTGLANGWTIGVGRWTPTLPKTLSLLINMGHGLELEDIAGNAARGITIHSTAGGTDAAATVALYLVISAFRLLSAAEKAARTGDPKAFVGAMTRASKNSLEPSGKSVGIIGYGRIGKRIGQLLHALGMRVNYFNRNQKETNETGIAWNDLDEMVSAVDCIVLSCPYSRETHHILGRDRIKLMKPGARVVNVSRGKCVDEEALIWGIENGIIGGAGLDVYEFEPRISQKLLELDCVALLPHVGGLTT